MVTIGGVTIRRRIVATETLPTGEEMWSLDGALPVDLSPAMLNRCAWLEPCRMASDSIEIKWWGYDCLEASVPIVVLP